MKMKKLKIVLKRVKIRHLIILTFMLMFNAFAWFIYATEVSNGVNAHVRSWKIMFRAGEQEISNYVEINIENIYPGMPTFVKELTAYNMSEVPATMSFEILEARILDEEITTTEGMIENGSTPTGEEMSSAELTEYLKTNYPFKIDVSISEVSLSPGTGEAIYKIEVSWPYESGNDELDTTWGQKAYTYHKNNPDDYSINLNIKLVAIQV